MTNIPAPGADLATERLRDLLTAAGNASFECGAHDCDGDDGDPAPYAELARIAAEKRAEVVEFFHASIAAVPAIEPVDVKAIHAAVLKLRVDPAVTMPEKVAFQAGVHRAAAVVSGFSNVAAPVSGMPDLARVEMLLEVIRMVRQYPDFDAADNPFGIMMDEALAGKVPALLGTIDSLANGLMPQAPNTPNPTGESK